MRTLIGIAAAIMTASALARSTRHFEKAYAHYWTGCLLGIDTPTR